MWVGSSCDNQNTQGNGFLLSINKVTNLWTTVAKYLDFTLKMAAIKHNFCKVWTGLLLIKFSFWNIMRKSFKDLFKNHSPSIHDCVDSSLLTSWGLMGRVWILRRNLKKKTPSQKKCYHSCYYLYMSTSILTYSWFNCLYCRSLIIYESHQLQVLNVWCRYIDTGKCIIVEDYNIKYVI